MQLDYWTLLCPTPLYMSCGCSVTSPKLSKLDLLPQKYQTYQYYLALLSMDISAYYDTITNDKLDYFASYSLKEKQHILHIQEDYEALSEEERTSLCFLDILENDAPLLSNLMEALSFFLCEKAVYSHQQRGITFLNTSGKESAAVGFLPNKQYLELADVVLQRNYISGRTSEEFSNVKNKTALKIMQKINKGRMKSKHRGKSDPAMELANLISSVSARHPSIQILNIWNLTVYQLYDLFFRMQENSIFDIMMTSTAVWGNDGDRFHLSDWYKYGKR